MTEKSKEDAIFHQALSVLAKEPDVDDTFGQSITLTINSQQM